MPRQRAPTRAHRELCGAVRGHRWGNRESTGADRARHHQPRARPRTRRGARPPARGCRRSCALVPQKQVESLTQGAGARTRSPSRAPAGAQGRGVVRKPLRDNFHAGSRLPRRRRLPMSDVRPFRALRPRPELAERVAAPPYDVINSDEAREMAEGNEISFLHINKPEIDLPPDVSLYDDRVYATGAAQPAAVHGRRRVRARSGAALLRLPAAHGRPRAGGDRVRGELPGVRGRPDQAPRVHAQGQGGRPHPPHPRAQRQRRAGLPHLPEARRDRRDRGRRPQGRPDLRLRGVRRHRPHGLDRLPRRDGGAAAGDPGGAGALRRRRPPPRRLGRAGRPRAQGRQPRAPRRRALQLLPRRAVPPRPAAHHGLQPRREGPRGAVGGGVPREGGREVHGGGPGEPRPDAPRRFGMFLGGKWYRLEAKPGTFAADDPVRSLDAAILQENLLAPVLGIADPRTDKRIDFVGGIRGLASSRRRVPRGGRWRSPSSPPRSTSSCRWPTPGW